MCKPEFISKKASHAPPALTKSSSSFLSVDAFETKPSVATLGAYATVIVACLTAVEYGLRFLFQQYKVRFVKIMCHVFRKVAHITRTQYFMICS